MIRTALAALSLVASASTASAQQLVLRLGRMGQVVAQEAGPPEPPRGENVVGSTPVFDPKFVTLGPDIVAKYCKQFGLEFEAANLPSGTAAPVTVSLQHPLWTLPDGRTSTVETNSSGVSPDHWSYTGYTLEEPWSLVPGTWTFTITQGPRILATASFNLTVDPGQDAPPKDGCTALTS
ncbi:DUF3859 domain-containing protein [Acidisphaera sp. L21]|uniref:DUF3859 domain-containing protein n=1 Tax=Acidisphaera sp. L21 TaxID=1641851 RepID=UPI00131EA4E6|nr:DUF3859 domain-containing protein [Acidisphaera sp. L21]